MARISLDDMTLDMVTGGTAFDTVAKTIGIDKDHLNYSYGNLDAVRAWIAANVRDFDPATRESDVINGLLAAGLIW